MVTKNALNDKLDLILKNEKKILANQKKILGEEEKIESLEEKEINKEDLNQKTEEDALKELQLLEKQMKKGLFTSLNKITKRDIFKGFVGAFVGILGHFAFMEAFHLSHDLTLFRASLFYIIALFMIIVMLYYTGFKKIKKQIILKFMPLRAILLYGVSIIAILIVNLVFGNIEYPVHFEEIYKLVAASIMLAVIGAGTADLIGGNAE